MNSDVQYFGMSVDDVALTGWSQAGNLRKLLAFFAAEGVPATFFVVPLDEDSGRPFQALPGDYAGLLRDAYASGHAIGQHGLRHNRFEFGIPPAMILDLPHESENKRFAEENRQRLAGEHVCEKLRPRLRQGREILEDALGFPIVGFRSPALQESPGMFAAIAAEGYQYDSSQCLQETGWDYLLDRMDVPPREITRARWEKIRRKCQTPILPLTCDYTWYLSRKKYDQVLALAQHDFHACLREGLPMVTVCHVDPVWDGEGIRFLREFYTWARSAAASQGKTLQFMTLDDLALEVE